MSQEYKKLEGYIESIREKTDMKPDVAIILGSGLDAFVDCLDNQVNVVTEKFQDIQFVQTQHTEDVMYSETLEIQTSLF